MKYVLKLEKDTWSVDVIDCFCSTWTINLAFSLDNLNKLNVSDFRFVDALESIIFARMGDSSPNSIAQLLVALLHNNCANSTVS